MSLLLGAGQGAGGAAVAIGAAYVGLSKFIPYAADLAADIVVKTAERGWKAATGFYQSEEMQNWLVSAQTLESATFDLDGTYMELLGNSIISTYGRDTEEYTLMSKMALVLGNSVDKVRTAFSNNVLPGGRRFADHGDVGTSADIPSLLEALKLECKVIDMSQDPNVLTVLGVNDQARADLKDVQFYTYAVGRCYSRISRARCDPSDLVQRVVWEETESHLFEAAQFQRAAHVLRNADSSIQPSDAELIQMNAETLSLVNVLAQKENYPKAIVTADGASTSLALLYYGMIGDFDARHPAGPKAWDLLEQAGVNSAMQLAVSWNSFTRMKANVFRNAPDYALVVSRMTGEQSFLTGSVSSTSQIAVISKVFSSRGPYQAEFGALGNCEAAMSVVFKYGPVPRTPTECEIYWTLKDHMKTSQASVLDTLPDPWTDKPTEQNSTALKTWVETQSPVREIVALVSNSKLTQQDADREHIMMNNVFGGTDPWTPPVNSVDDRMRLARLTVLGTPGRVADQTSRYWRATWQPNRITLAFRTALGCMALALAYKTRSAWIPLCQLAFIKLKSTCARESVAKAVVMAQQSGFTDTPALIEAAQRDYNRIDAEEQDAMLAVVPAPSARDIKRQEREADDQAADEQTKKLMPVSDVVNAATRVVGAATNTLSGLEDRSVNLACRAFVAGVGYIGSAAEKTGKGVETYVVPAAQWMGYKTMESLSTDVKARQRRDLDLAIDTLKQIVRASPMLPTDEVRILALLTEVRTAYDDAVPLVVQSTVIQRLGVTARVAVAKLAEYTPSTSTLLSILPQASDFNSPDISSLPNERARDASLFLLLLTAASA